MVLTYGPAAPETAERHAPCQTGRLGRIYAAAHDPVRQDDPRELEGGRIVIEPLNGSARSSRPSVDLHVDRYFRVFRNDMPPYIDPEEAAGRPDGVRRGRRRKAFILHPGEFVLGSTRERVALGDDLVARLEGKSRLGRLGLLIHSTAGFVGCGLQRPSHARALERRILPIAIYPRDERPDLVSADEHRRRAPLWKRMPHGRNPGPARPDTVALLPELPRGRVAPAPLRPPGAARVVQVGSLHPRSIPQLLAYPHVDEV